MKCIKAVTLGFILLSFSQFSMATNTNVVKCRTVDDGTTAKYDYGNALKSYGSACNATDRWQNLGTDGDWSADKRGTQYNESQDDSTNNGVTWRVQQADGSWTAFGTSATLIQGQDVEFQFQVTRSTDGWHKYDLLKAWVDWNGSGKFWNNNNFTDQQMFTGAQSYKNHEVIINEAWWKNKDSDGNTTTTDNNLANQQGLQWNGDLNKWNSNDTEAFFYTTLTVPMDSVVGDTWMRARVVCENSLENHSNNMNLLPKHFQDQGETEDYKLTIAKKVDVPEPSTLVVFLSGMMLLMVKRRKANSGFNA